MSSAIPCCIITACSMPNEHSCCFNDVAEAIKAKVSSLILFRQHGSHWEVYFTCFVYVNVLMLKENFEKVILNQDQSQNFTQKLHQTMFHFKTKTCCVVVVQYLAMTLTIINIHETATLQPRRMVKLIMLTGSFNCFIQSKQFSCNK